VPGAANRRTRETYRIQYVTAQHEGCKENCNADIIPLTVEGRLQASTRSVQSRERQGLGLGFLEGSLRGRLDILEGTSGSHTCSSHSGNYMFNSKDIIVSLDHGSYMLFIYLSLGMEEDFLFNIATIPNPHHEALGLYQDSLDDS
jgi:hypothetical protein